MGWSRAFLAAISGPVRPRLRVSVEGFGANPDWNIAAWRLVSDPDLPGDPILSREGWSFAGARIDPWTWRGTSGVLSLRIMRPSLDLRRRIVRGQPVVVRVGFAGWPYRAFEVVGVYQVWALTGQGGGFTLVLRDFLAALSSRLTTDTDKIALFQDLVTTSITTTAAYTAGSGLLVTSSASGFRRQDDGSGTLKGCVRIDGEFFRTWTAKTATDLTVSTSAYNLNTADASVGSGTGVTEVAFLDDHPLTAVRRILLSSGTTGFRGIYDTLPESWGYALPAWIVDQEDLAAGVAASQPASGSADWLIWAAEAQSDGRAWIEGWLCQGGYGLTVRQGAVTARPIPAPTSKFAQVWRIDDADLIEVAAFDAFDPGGVEYATLNVAYGTASGGTALSSTTAAVATLPAGQAYTLDLTDYVSDNGSAIATEIRDRVAIWYQRAPERLRILCAGLRLAAPAPGDLAELTSRRIGGRADPAGYLRRRGLILEVSPNWIEGTTTIEILIAPDDAQIGS